MATPLSTVALMLISLLPQRSLSISGFCVHVPNSQSHLQHPDFPFKSPPLPSSLPLMTPLHGSFSEYPSIFLWHVVPCKLSVSNLLEFNNGTMGSDDFAGHLHKRVAQRPLSFLMSLPQERADSPGWKLHLKVARV
ncbi:hypothetical protein NL676_037907 [Syzygium grande]|nr:hypothetical protein NL676_037907 [Syzygium grande]